MIPRLALLVIMFLMSLNDSLAIDTFNFPGGVVQFNVSKQSDDIPSVKFGLNEPVILEYEQHWRILIGLSLTTIPGEYIAYIKSGIEGSTAQYETIIVKQHTYPFKEYLPQNSNNLNLPKTQRHASLSDINFSNTQQPTLPLNRPVEGNWSNDFGHKFYDTNNKIIQTPNFITLSTTKLTAVIAPQDAIVSKIETSEAGLSTVFLDHGRGLYSVLAGLSDLTIEVGNGIASRAVIGKLRATTGSSVTLNKLVWQTVINNTYVDPQILTTLEP